MEYLEIWDWETGKPTGKSVERKESHRNGVPHEGVHLWIYRVHDAKTELILQRRAKNKDLYPGYFDISVGGHVPFGFNEGKIQKEAREELGLELDERELLRLGMFRYEERVPEMNLFHREFQSVYVVRIDWELSDYRFNDGEVDAVCAIDAVNFSRLINRESDTCMIELYDGIKTYEKLMDYSAFHPLFFTKPMKIYLEVVLGAVNDAVAGKKEYRKFEKF